MSTLLSALTWCGTMAASAAPVVTSVAPNIGNPAGGGSTRTITGSGFTGATGVTFGGSAATSVTVVNDTTITCTAPAHAAGQVDVVVTGPGGSGTGTNAYEYWEPSVETLRCLYRAPNYSDAGAGTWTADVGTNLTGTAEPNPVAVGGAPDCEASTDFPLGNAVDADTWLGTGDTTLFAVFDAESITRNSATSYLNDPIIGDAGQFCGLFLRKNGSVLTFYFYEWDGAEKKASLDVSSLGNTTTGAGHYILLAKKDAGTLYVWAANASTGSSVWTAGDACGSLDAGATGLRSGSGAATGDGIIKVMGVASSAWSQALAEKFVRWARAEHP